MMAYIDIKNTVWERFYFEENEIDMDKLKLYIAQNNTYPAELEIVESELVYDTIEEIDSDESNYSPMEIISNNETIYFNDDDSKAEITDKMYKKFQKDYNGEEPSNELYAKFLKISNEVKNFEREE